MLERFRLSRPLEEIAPVCTAEEMAQAQQLYVNCQVSQPVMDYMAALCEAARDPGAVRLGPSPRAMLSLMRACQALAALRGRDYVIPDDVKELAVPVLAHRLVMRGFQGQKAETFIQETLRSLPAPTEEAR